ncbi:PIN domain-containing protein [Jiella sonneratiae]|uniref:PIN domain-containing protein n=1 Tax=Jiella sonneratiae TaxID=2816856 RepID=A0ABS3J7D6_9HYPH|nr:PIN domain-containing protein [Jiella sonneratiae]MBO0905579.1 PIN domain-containing protein [Jiella sonneratiae]
MFANRFTALIDACTLAGTLRRNLLLSLAEAEFFRIRWSEQIMEETERAINAILEGKNAPDAAERASRARKAMEGAFEEAMVFDFDLFLPACGELPDPGDAHVLAAAIKTQAAIIVTENLKDFPPAYLDRFGIEVRSADAFLANTIALDEGKAVAAIRIMRKRLKIPEKTPAILLLEMEAAGLTETVDVLRSHERSL